MNGGPISFLYSLKEPLGSVGLLIILSSISTFLFDFDWTGTCRYKFISAENQVTVHSILHTLVK